MIPKIVHKIAPENDAVWKIDWHKCNIKMEKESNDFDYSIHIWPDTKEYAESFVEKNYPRYFESFKRIEASDIKIKAFKYLIMHKYGGIFTEMSYYITSDFFTEIEKMNLTKPALVESKTSQIASAQAKYDDTLMCSPTSDKFWLSCYEKIVELYDKHEFKFELEKSIEKNIWLNSGWLIKKISGSIMLSEIIETGEYEISVLPKTKFNPNIELDDDILEFFDEYTGDVRTEDGIEVLLRSTEKVGIYFSPTIWN